MELQKRNLEMSRNVLTTLIDRGLIIDETDALKKLNDSDWLTKEGCSHIAHVLRRTIDVDVCRSVFTERSSNSPASTLPHE